MGGYIALAFYKLFPERVRALVLADTRAAADTDEVKQSRRKQAERALRDGMEGIAPLPSEPMASPGCIASPYGAPVGGTAGWPPFIRCICPSSVPE